MSVFDLIFLGSATGLGLLLVTLLGIEEKRRPKFQEWIGGALPGLAIGVLAAAIIGSFCAWDGCSRP